ncbi:LLM class flavin-dependent oxidoreductase [Patulibacter americanus]|uniref:LLM class flavin-dependent oxidoreductase n=1 Tax=Patulibacter americanus TaxID=588672 RepID=UPI0003B5ED89|nr:LLM class flavin-dependent oxidoreductase [Patulibacter americanus]
MSDVALSVLDLAPVADGSTPSRALENALDLTRHVEALGYGRVWVAEHHNMPGIASSSPPVLIAHLAAHTDRIRLGSGGVMLPNHAPLVVAEQFGMLEALHPGRIDLGLGRAPGTDGLTAAALRRSSDPFGNEDDFPAQLAELRGFLRGDLPREHPLHRIKAVPNNGREPDVWLLGSSGFSAQLAGELGLPFSFAHHFSAQNTVPAVDMYRSSFRASEVLERPYVMLGVNVVAADDDERARFLAGSANLQMMRLRQGNPGLLPTPEEAEKQLRGEAAGRFVASRAASQIVGGPDTVRRGIEELLARTNADELMVTTSVHDHGERRRSFEIVAEVMDLAPREARSAAGATTA